MCEFAISKAACNSVVATTAIYYFDGRVSITQQNPRGAFSSATGSFSLSSSLVVFPLFLSFSLASSRLERSRAILQRGTMLPNRVSRQFSPSVWRDTLPSGVWCTIDGGVERRRQRQSAKPAMASMASKLCDEKSSILSS